jgi:hypothetical protein
MREQSEEVAYWNAAAASAVAAASAASIASTAHHTQGVVAGDGGRLTPGVLPAGAEGGRDRENNIASPVPVALILRDAEGKTVTERPATDSLRPRDSKMESLKFKPKTGGLRSNTLGSGGINNDAHRSDRSADRSSRRRATEPARGADKNDENNEPELFRSGTSGGRHSIDDKKRHSTPNIDSSYPDQLSARLLSSADINDNSQRSNNNLRPVSADHHQERDRNYQDRQLERAREERELEREERELERERHLEQLRSPPTADNVKLKAATIDKVAYSERSVVYSERSRTVSFLGKSLTGVAADMNINSPNVNQGRSRSPPAVRNSRGVNYSPNGQNLSTSPGGGPTPDRVTGGSPTSPTNRQTPLRAGSPLSGGQSFSPNAHINLNPLPPNSGLSISIPRSPLAGASELAARELIAREHGLVKRTCSSNRSGSFVTQRSKSPKDAASSRGGSSVLGGSRISSKESADRNASRKSSVDGGSPPRADAGSPDKGSPDKGSQSPDKGNSANQTAAAAAAAESKDNSNSVINQSVTKERDIICTKDRDICTKDRNTYETSQPVQSPGQPAQSPELAQAAAAQEAVETAARAAMELNYSSENATIRGTSGRSRSRSDEKSNVNRSRIDGSTDNDGVDSDGDADNNGDADRDGDVAGDDVDNGNDGGDATEVTDNPPTDNPPTDNPDPLTDNPETENPPTAESRAPSKSTNSETATSEVSEGDSGDGNHVGINDSLELWCKMK